MVELPPWGAGGGGFDPRLGHTKYFKNGSDGCPSWRSWFQDSVPVVLVVHPGNTEKNLKMVGSDVRHQTIN